MTTTDNSRAYALTEQIIDAAIDCIRHDVSPDWQRSALRSRLNAIFAASPVEQHEAAPADDYETRRRVAEALGITWPGTRDGKRVGYAWSYLLGCIKDVAQHEGARKPPVRSLEDVRADEAEHQRFRYWQQWFVNHSGHPMEPVDAWQLRATLDRAPRTDVTGGVLVPRADLEAIYAAMNHLGDVLNEMDAVEAEDEAATEPGFAAIRRALSEGCDGAPSADAAAAPADEPTIPAELHPDTAKLVRRFARALANKLLAAQRKYGYSDNWMRDGWADECRAELMRHIHKGDPRDVAAYCAFLWHHNESTAPAPADAQAAGMFVKRSMFGPWIEVDKPEPGVVRLYFGPQPQADAQPVEAVAIPACYTQAPLALLPRVADLLHLLSFATIHTPSEGDEPQIRRALHDIKAMIAAAPQPPAQANAREGLTDEQRAVMQDAARSLSVRADELKEYNTSIDGEWCDADEKAAYDAEVRLVERLRAILATHPGQPEPRECRHCGWMCIPNSTPSKTVYPLAQQEPRAMLTVDESNLLARINDATKPVDVADRHAVIKLVERLAVFALMPEIPCE
ncbi:hypothetical protein LGN12_18460 [Burkholderia multivorans]|nr:hypothetical protein [Burkholderia multivorans]